MKTLILFFALLTANATWTPANATDEKYLKAMESAITAVNSAKSPEAMLTAANTLERIAAAEPKEWLPRYWAGYAYTTLSFMEKESAKKDQYLDKAELLVGQANELAANNDEIAVLQGYIAQGRLMVDPQARWEKYGQLYGQAFGKAKALNPENPRVYLLEGRSLMGTPEAYGGGAAKACPVMKMAVDKFAAFKPASSIHPNWGGETANGIYSSKCGK